MPVSLQEAIEVKKMGRGRLATKLIENEKARKATFQKRKNGLMKKVHELSTLCGVDSCLIIYSPKFNDQLNHPNQLETWPQDPRQVHRVIKKYEAKISQKPPRNYDVYDFFKDRRNKVEAETSKLNKERFRMLYPTWNNNFNSLGEDQLRMFVSILDVKLEDCKLRINVLRKRRYLKEKAAESEGAAITNSCNASNRSHLNFMKNKSQTQIFSAPSKKLGDNNNQLAYPLHQFDKSSQIQMLHFDPNLNEMVVWNGQVGTDKNSALSYYDSMLEMDGARNNPDSSLCYYSGGLRSAQPYNYYPYLQKFPSQNMQYHEATLQAQTNGYQDLLQVQMFHYMNTKK